MIDDTPTTLPGGATVIVPEGWTTRQDDEQLSLTPPEADLRITLTTIEGGEEDAAAAEAWRRHDEAPLRAVAQSNDEAPRGGWDEIRVRTYETSPNEHRIAQAMLFRRGGAWTVVIVDGSFATWEKRMSAVFLVTMSVRAPGFVRESFAGRTPHRLDEARIDALRAFLRGAMARLSIPGIGWALVEQGKVIVAEGLGVRTVGSDVPVDADTRFMIASNTKSLTTLMLASLVDDGKLSWDKPVTEVYSAFRFGGSADPKAVQVRHLLSAATGLPRRDVWGLTNTRETPAAAVFDLLATIEPTSKFGEVYQYNNPVAAAAGFVGGHAAYPDLELGAAYDRAMQERVFDPLGMTRTTFDFSLALAGDYASPHSQTLSGDTVPVNTDVLIGTIAVRPTGGAWSTARDMAQVVLLELAKGRLPDGSRLISEDNLLFRRRRGVRIGEDAAYGNGLRIEEANDVLVLRHGGSLPGFMSDFYVIPDAQVGAVLLTNADNGMYLLHPFKRRLLELLYDGNEEAVDEIDRIAARRSSEVAALRDTGQAAVDADVARSLAPAYRSDEAGLLATEMVGDRLYFRFAAFAAQVATRRHPDGSLSFVVIEPGMFGLSFVVDDRDGTHALVFRDGQREYRFVEAAA